MQRTGVVLERQLARSQQQPVPFFGTVLSGEVDLAALEAVWCGTSVQEVAAPEMTPAPVAEVAPPDDLGPEPEIDQAGVVPSVVGTEPSPALPPPLVSSAPAKMDTPVWHLQSASADLGTPADASTVTHDLGLCVPMAPGARV